jgi:hypothetical protein
MIKEIAKIIVRYIFNILIAIDQLFNAILFGDPDETISSRIGKKIRAGTKNKFLIVVAKILDWIDPNHVIKTIEDDEGKRAIIEKEGK